LSNFVDRFLRAEFLGGQSRLLRVGIFLFCAIFLVAGLATFFLFARRWLDSTINPDTHWLEAILLSIPFLMLGICGCGFAIFSGWLGRRTIALRKVTAEHCDLLGAHQISAKLTHPEHWDEDEHGHIVFTDGDHLFSALIAAAICIAMCGLLGALSFELIRDPPSSLVLILILIPAVLGVCGTAWFARIKFFKPRPPVLVFTTSPLQPIDDEKEVALNWAFIGNPTELQDMEGLSFAILRSTRDHIRTPPTTDWAIDMGAEAKNIREGTTTIHVPETAKKSFFGIGHTDASQINLKVGWRKRGEPSRESSFTLTASESA
jgi:hypothetical protein